MNKVVEIEIEIEIGIGIGIGIDHQGNADMFDPDSDPEKTFQVRPRLGLVTLSAHPLK
jgi:hypothetical protein